MAREADGLTIRFQGKPCLPQFEYNRSVGLEPSHGVVFMELQDLGDFSVEEIIPDETTGEFKTQERQKGLQSAGLLEFIEVELGDDGVTDVHEVTWANMLVTEKAIEVAYADDDSKNEVVKIELTDIRYMWGTRGVIDMWVNVPKRIDPDATNPDATPTGPGSDAATQKAQRDQLAAVARRVEANASTLQTLKSLTEYAKLKVERDKLAAGDNKTKQSEAELQKFDALGEQLSLQNIEAKAKGIEVAMKLDQTFMEQYQQEHAKDAEAKAHQSARPVITDVGIELIPSSTDGGKPWTLKRLLEEKVLPALWGRPKLTRIPGDVAAATVGAKHWDPPMLPKRALQELLDEFQVVFVLNSDSSCSIWKKNEGQLREESSTGDEGSKIEFNPAVKLEERVANARRLLSFSRVPEVVQVIGAPRISSKKERLEPVGMKDGKIVPLAEALEAIGLSMPQAQAFALLPHSGRAALLGVFQDGLKEFEKWAFKWFRLPGSPEDLAERLPILDARAAFGTTGDFLPERVWSRGHAVISTLDALSVLQKIQTTAAAGSASAPAFVVKALAALKAADTKALNAVVNVDFSEQASGYTIDRRRGIVKFDRIQGPVSPEGGTLETASIDARGLQVELEYAYVVKPGYQFGSGLSVDQRYSSIWVRDSKGQAVQRNAIPLGVSPLPVYRPDLQKIEKLDGTTNKELLDAVAKGIAQHQFDLDLPHAGAVVELCRPVQVEMNGSVLSCSWAVNDEVPSTTAHVGAFAPLAPAPKLATRAFGDIGRFDRLAKDSTFAPGGISQ